MGKVMLRLSELLFSWWLRHKVIQPRRLTVSRRFATDFQLGHSTLSAKLWSYRRGFLSNTVSSSNITDGNAELFISELEYNGFKGFPNGPRSRWFDDKLATYHILGNHRIRLPEHYFHISGGKVVGLAGRADGFKSFEDLLYETKSLVAKDTWGFGGKGLRLITRTNNHIDINGHEVEFSAFQNVVDEWPDSIVTERLENHPDIGRLYARSLNTLRIITAYSPTYGVTLVSHIFELGQRQVES